MTKLIKIDFLRHGQTYFNLYKKLQGWSGALLTEKGVKSIKDIAIEYRNIEYDYIFSSDAQRTLDTAKIFLDVNEVTRNKGIFPVTGLRELGFGSFEGTFGPKTWEMVAVKARNHYNLSKNEEISLEMKINMLHMLDPYGLAEDYNTYINRITNAVTDTVDNLPPKENGYNILMVSHGTTIHQIFSHMDEDFTILEEPGNSTISTLIYREGKFETERYGSFIRHVQ